MSKTRLSKEYKRKHRNPAPKGKLGQTSSGKPRRLKGRPAGKRNTSAEPQKTQSGQGKQRDPRIGSNKPVALGADKPAPQTGPAKSIEPKTELSAIENDDKLNRLLDKAEQNQPLSRKEITYMEAQLERHAELCEQLGIDNAPEDDEQESALSDDDLLDKLDASPLNDFKTE